MRRPSLLRRLGWRLGIGHRAAFLLLFGGIYVVIGLGIVLAPIPPDPDLFHTQLPVWVRVTLWTASGGVAIAVARLKKLQWLGFAALAPPAVERSLSYAWSMINHLLTDIDPLPLWLRLNALALYVLLLITIRLVASWPDPPEDDERWRP